MWEFPCHGWHENVLKGYNGTPGRVRLWPPLYPELQLAGLVKTPEEESTVHRFFIDQALAQDLEHVSLIWHPWSLGRFDSEMHMLELIFDHLASQEICCVRFEDLWRRRVGASE